MEPKEARKSRSFVFVCILYAVLSLLMVAGVMAMAKYMGQN